MGHSWYTNSFMLAYEEHCVVRYFSNVKIHGRRAQGFFWLKWQLGW